MAQKCLPVIHITQRLLAAQKPSKSPSRPGDCPTLARVTPKFHLRPQLLSPGDQTLEPPIQPSEHLTTVRAAQRLLLRP